MLSGAYGGHEYRTYLSIRWNCDRYSPVREMEVVKPYPLPYGRGSDGRGSDVAHPLFVSQRNGGIDAGDSEGGNKSRDDGDAEQHGGYGGKGECIIRLHAPDQGPH